MTYREDLEGERMERWVCPDCGSAAGEVDTVDTGWDDSLDHYIEYAVFTCGDCGREHRVRIVYSETEWIKGWGHHPEE